MDILHQMDQMKAMLRDFAPVLATYRNELMKCGFTEEQAFDLARDFQTLSFNNAKGDK